MFGYRLAQLRKRQGITQQALADALGLDCAVIEECEAQDKIPKSDDCKKICGYFGVAMDYMMITYQVDETEIPIRGRIKVLGNDDIPEDDLRDLLDYAMCRFPQKFRQI